MKNIITSIVLLFFVPIQLNAQNWNEIVKLTASDRGNRDHFGNSVAISGNYAIVGAYYEDEDANGSNTMSLAGSAYIFEKDASGNWNLAQKIVASDRSVNDRFGSTVAISGDYAIVGAFFQDSDENDSNPLSDTGAAYIFHRNANGIWEQTQKIVASDRDFEDYFGYAVAISGNYAIISASNEDEDANGGTPLNNAGSAYIFEKDATGNWNEVQKIVSSDREAYDHFGASVAISGNLAIVGADNEDEDENGGYPFYSSGSAYIFERDTSGNWNLTQKIVASDRYENNWFGRSVGISGNYAIVGADGKDNMAGAAYIFTLDGGGVWYQAQKLLASDRSSNDKFGNSVSISDDKAIVGAFFEDEDANGGNTMSLAGSAYIFEKDASGNWNQTQKIVASDRDSQDVFGYSVAIYDNYAFVGAINESEDANNNNHIFESGSVYVFGTSNSGIIQNDFGKYLVMYPNPNTGKFVIDLGKIYNKTEIIITDNTGKTIYSNNYKQTQTINVSIENAYSGVYLVNIKSGDKKAVFKLIKK